MNIRRNERLSSSDLKKNLDLCQIRQRSFLFGLLNFRVQRYLESVFETHFRATLKA